jgi:ATP-dependent protease ClpP protease subunit
MKSPLLHFGWFLGALLSLASPSARAMFCDNTSCVMQTAKPGVYLVEIDGPIEGTLVREIEAVLRKGGRINSLGILRSPGGDVEAAMALGRILRAQRVGAQVTGDCASACVFAIAGPLWRSYSTARIGLHRPYFDSASSSPAEAGQRIKALNASLRAYLEEMNVSTALLDAMNAVPSDQIRWVTPAEVNSLGLLDVDPVYEEFTDGKQAAKMGISRTEYLGRKAQFKEQCQARFGYWQPEFCACVDRVKFRGPGDKWLCDP